MEAQPTLQPTTTAYEAQQEYNRSIGFTDDSMPLDDQGAQRTAEADLNAVREATSQPPGSMLNAEGQAQAATVAATTTSPDDYLAEPADEAPPAARDYAAEYNKVFGENTAPEGLDVERFYADVEGRKAEEYARQDAIEKDHLYSGYSSFLTGNPASKDPDDNGNKSLVREAVARQLGDLATDKKIDNAMLDYQDEESTTGKLNGDGLRLAERMRTQIEREVKEKEESFKKAGTDHKQRVVEYRTGVTEAVKNLERNGQKLTTDEAVRLTDHILNGGMDKFLNSASKQKLAEFALTTIPDLDHKYNRVVPYQKGEAVGKKGALAQRLN